MSDTRSVCELLKAVPEETQPLIIVLMQEYTSALLRSAADVVLAANDQTQASRVLRTLSEDHRAANGVMFDAGYDVKENG